MSEEKLWDRMKQTFEEFYHEGEKAAEVVAESLEGVGNSARAERDRQGPLRASDLQAIGGARWRRLRARQGSRQVEDTAGRETQEILADPEVRKLLEEIAAIDLEIWDARSRAARQ